MKVKPSETVIERIIIDEWIPENKWLSKHGKLKLRRKKEGTTINQNLRERLLASKDNEWNGVVKWRKQFSTLNSRWEMDN